MTKISSSGALFQEEGLDVEGEICGQQIYEDARGRSSSLCFAPEHQARGFQHTPLGWRIGGVIGDGPSSPPFCAEVAQVFRQNGWVKNRPSTLRLEIHRKSPALPCGTIVTGT
jgi:hypothetical protein